MSRRAQKKTPGFKRHFNPLIWLVRHAQMSLASLGRLFRHPLPTLMTATVIGIAIALPAGLHVLIDNVRSLSNQWDGGSSMSLFLKQDMDDHQAEKIRHTLQQRPDIAEAVLITKSQAMAEFRQQSGFGAALDLLDNNPLPAVILVRPEIPQGDPVAATTQLAQSLQAFREIELAQVDLQWVQRLNAITLTLERGVAVLAALLSAAVLLIIGNTIRLEIQNRHTEIEITKLVGGTNAFIRRPFLYEGIWYGLLGALIALLLVILALALMTGPVQELAGLYGSEFSLGLITSGTFFGILLGSPLLGLLGAWLAVGRHLKQIVPE